MLKANIFQCISFQFYLDSYAIYSNLIFSSRCYSQFVIVGCRVSYVLVKNSTNTCHKSYLNSNVQFYMFHSQVITFSKKEELL